MHASSRILDPELILLIKEHEPTASMTASGNKPWRMQKIFLDLTTGGIDCRLFMSSFDHWTKTQTSNEQLLPIFRGVELVRAPAYPRNNSILRLVSGTVFATRVLLACLAGPRPSLIVVAYPGFLIVLVAQVLKLRYGCKVWVDVRDNWPATLSGFFPPLFRAAARLVFTWYLGILLRFVDEILVPSENLYQFVSGLTRKSIAKIPFLLDPALIPAIGPDAGRDMIFLGSLNSFFDYDVFDHAAAYCEQNGILFHIFGDGEHYQDLRSRFAECAHVRVHGNVSYAQVIAMSSTCRIGLYPYLRNSGFDNHETNKLTDYLLMGLTIFSSVPLPIDPTYWRPFPTVLPELATLPSKLDVRQFGMTRFAGSYYDHFRASGLLVRAA